MLRTRIAQTLGLLSRPVTYYVVLEAPSRIWPSEWDQVEMGGHFATEDEAAKAAAAIDLSEEQAARQAIHALGRTDGLARDAIV